MSVEVVDAVQKVLEQDGTLSEIRAKLKATIFSIISKSANSSSIESSRATVKARVDDFVSKESGKITIELISDFLRALRLSNTLAVFELEVGHIAVKRNELTEVLGLDDIVDPSISILAKFINDRNAKTAKFISGGQFADAKRNSTEQFSDGRIENALQTNHAFSDSKDSTFHPKESESPEKGEDRNEKLTFPDRSPDSGTTGRSNSGMQQITKQPKKGNILLIIDPQNDFHPGGSLAVNGANEDSERTADFIMANINKIDEIVVTLDTHHKNHIAHGVFWLNKKNEQPEPFTIISNKDVQEGKWRPKKFTNLAHCKDYTKYLEGQGKYELCIWPEHCLIGSTGHAVVPVLNRALQEWAGIRRQEVHYVYKGQNCLTEMYSAIKADYVIESDARTDRDPVLMSQLQNTEQLIVCGQALSHCVKSTFLDILETWPKGQNSRLVLLTDACSPVTGFERQAEEFVERIRRVGCTLSTTISILGPPPVALKRIDVSSKSEEKTQSMDTASKISVRRLGSGSTTRSSSGWGTSDSHLNDDDDFLLMDDDGEKQDAKTSGWDRRSGGLDSPTSPSSPSKESQNSSFDAEPLPLNRKSSPATSPKQFGNPAGAAPRRAFSPTDADDLHDSFEESNYESDNEDVLHRSNQEEEPDYIESHKLRSQSDRGDNDYDFDSVSKPVSQASTQRPSSSLFAKRDAVPTAVEAPKGAKSPHKKQKDDDDGDDYGEDFEEEEEVEEDDDAEEIASEVADEEEDEEDDVSVGAQDEESDDGFGFNDSPKKQPSAPSLLSSSSRQKSGFIQSLDNKNSSLSQKEDSKSLETTHEALPANSNGGTRAATSAAAASVAAGLQKSAAGPRGHFDDEFDVDSVASDDEEFSVGGAASASDSFNDSPKKQPSASSLLSSLSRQKSGILPSIDDQKSSLEAKEDSQSIDTSKKNPFNNARSTASASLQKSTAPAFGDDDEFEVASVASEEEEDEFSVGGAGSDSDDGDFAYSAPNKATTARREEGSRTGRGGGGGGRGGSLAESGDLEFSANDFSVSEHELSHSQGLDNLSGKGGKKYDYTTTALPPRSSSGW